MNEINIDDHRKIGEIMKVLNDKLTHEYTRVYNSCSSKVRGHKKARYHRNAIKGIRTARTCLEEIAFKQYPKEATTKIYYGERPKEWAW